MNEAHVNQSEVCKCGCPKQWHMPDHAHRRWDGARPGKLCTCYEFVQREPERPSNAELIVKVRKGLLSDAHRGHKSSAWDALTALERRLASKGEP